MEIGGWIVAIVLYLLGVMAVYDLMRNGSDRGVPWPASVEITIVAVLWPLFEVVSLAEELWQAARKRIRILRKRTGEDAK